MVNADIAGKWLNEAKAEIGLFWMHHRYHTQSSCWILGLSIDIFFCCTTL